jgi:hypothetical protein
MACDKQSYYQFVLAYIVNMLNALIEVEGICISGMNFFSQLGTTL